MKKLFLVGVVFCLFLFVKVTFTKAQMMEYPATTLIPSSQNSQDDSAGKEVWDKLQKKQVACKDLKDNDLDRLGNFFMGNMMGSNHVYMDQLMTQRLGESGEKQMHIAMGKRLSGCDSSASFPQGAEYFMPMMGFGGMTNGNWNQSWEGGERSMMGFGGWNNMMGSSWGILGGLTWLLIVVFLMLGIIHFWKEIGRKK